jgi:hypothetical protein
MALRGSLEDIQVRDLLEVLRLGSRTGELVVAGLDTDARLYFQDGKLVEAVGHGRSGVAVLTETLSWRDGEFEFRPEAEPPVHSDPELQSAVARVLAFPSGPGLLALPPVEPMLAPATAASAAAQAEVLSAFVTGVSLAEFACILDATGVIQAQSGSSLHPIAEMRALGAAANAFRHAHCRPELRRMLVEDDKGTAVVTRMADGSLLMVVADGRAGLGNVSAAVSKLAHQLEVES